MVSCADLTKVPFGIWLGVGLMLLALILVIYLVWRLRKLALKGEKRAKPKAKRRVTKGKR